MRCNNDQCQHHDGYERCAKPDQVIISSIGQCVLQFEPATKKQEPLRPKNKPTPEAVINWLLSCGGEATIRTMARKFRGFCGRSDDAFKFASELQNGGHGIEIAVTRNGNGRPATLVRIAIKHEQHRPTKLVTISTPSGTGESLRERFDRDVEPAIGGTKKPLWEQDEDPAYLVDRDELVAHIKKIGGECNASQARARFHKFKSAGSANRALSQLVIDGFGNWITYSSRSGQKFKKFVLKGYKSPQEPISDDISPIKENYDRSHPLAQPTDLQPGSKARIELMRERVEQNLPAVINGDRFGYEDEKYSG